MTDTLTINETEEKTDTDEPVVSHIVRSEDATRAYITGEPVEALCGHIWVPYRDPERYPVCDKCKDIFDQIQKARKGSN